MQPLPLRLLPKSQRSGCSGLQVIKGSHKLGRLNHASVRGQNGADPERVELAEAAGLSPVHCVLPRGGAVFFHCNTLHSSSPNHSENPRWGLICCYNTRGNGVLRGSENHPSYDMVGELEIWDDERVLELGQRQWAALSGTPAL